MIDENDIEELVNVYNKLYLDKKLLDKSLRAREESHKYFTSIHVDKFLGVVG